MTNASSSSVSSPNPVSRSTRLLWNVSSNFVRFRLRIVSASSCPCFTAASRCCQLISASLWLSITSCNSRASRRTHSLERTTSWVRACARTFSNDSILDIRRHFDTSVDNEWRRTNNIDPPWVEVFVCCLQRAKIKDQQPVTLLLDIHAIPYE